MFPLLFSSRPLCQDPRTKALRPTPLLPSSGQSDPAHSSYHIELEYASGIPLPDVEHRSDIVARRCRVCILEGTKPVSNLYMVKAEWDSSEEDRWRFGLKFQENDWNQLVWKTTKKNCTLLFELTCLVKKQGSNEKLKGESGEQTSGWQLGSADGCRARKPADPSS